MAHLGIRQGNKGLEVFTKLQIPANSMVLEFTGDIIPRNKLSFNLQQVLQVGADRFIGPSGAIDDYVNHSCDPNCMLYFVGNRAFLYSIYIIPAIIEITFVYSS